MWRINSISLISIVEGMCILEWKSLEIKNNSSKQNEIKMKIQRMESGSVAI